jgi:hypothetical protein
VDEAAIVVDVHVRQHHRFDVPGADAKAPQLRTHFLFGFDVEANAELEIRMPARQRFQMSRRSGVNDDHALGVLDRPGIDRRPFRPFPREDGLELPPQSVPPPFNLSLLYPHAAGLDGVNAHGVAH